MQLPSISWICAGLLPWRRGGVGPQGPSKTLSLVALSLVTINKNHAFCKLKGQQQTVYLSPNELLAFHYPSVPLSTLLGIPSEGVGVSQLCHEVGVSALHSKLLAEAKIQIRVCFRLELGNTREHHNGTYTNLDVPSVSHTIFTPRSPQLSIVPLSCQRKAPETWKHGNVTKRPCSLCCLWNKAKSRTQYHQYPTLSISNMSCFKTRQTWQTANHKNSKSLSCDQLNDRERHAHKLLESSLRIIKSSSTFRTVTNT